MLDHEIRKQIVDVAHMLDEKGLVGTYEGNISCKDGNRVFVTPTQHSKSLLTEGQIIAVDMNGKVIEGDLKPTSETLMHIKCYELRDDIGGVVHCHAPFATAYAWANEEITIKEAPEFLALFGKVPLLKYGTPGTLDIVADLEKYIMDYDVFLLANHGLLAVGKTPFEAYSKALSLEMILKTEVIRKLVNNKDTNLDDDEVEKMTSIGFQQKVHGYTK